MLSNDFVSILLLKYSADHIVTVSEYSKNILIRNFVNKKKVQRIYNGIKAKDKNDSLNLTRFNKVHNNNKTLYVGTVCRLDATKDLPNFLKCIKSNNKALHMSIELEELSILLKQSDILEAIRGRCD